MQACACTLLFLMIHGGPGSSFCTPQHVPPGLLRGAGGISAPPLVGRLCPQVLTLVYYVASYFPGGAAGAQVRISWLSAGATLCCKALNCVVPACSLRVHHAAVRCHCPAARSRTPQPFPSICPSLQSVVSFAGRGALSLGSAAFRASFRS